MDLGVGVSGLVSLQHYEKVPNTCVTLRLSSGNGWAAGSTHRDGHRRSWTVMWEIQGKHMGAMKEGHI